MKIQLNVISDKIRTSDKLPKMRHTNCHGSKLHVKVEGAHEAVTRCNRGEPGRDLYNAKVAQNYRWCVCRFVIDVSLKHGLTNGCFTCRTI